MDFSTLKSNRKSQFDKLAKAADAVNKSNGKQGGGDDDRFWKLTVDSAKNGSAIIRFLPPPNGEDVPFVRYWDHGFQGPGGWYIEKSLTSIGKDDPLGELNSKLWNSGNDEDKETARAQKRRLHYLANIYVVQDPGNPANDGKVFLFEFGKKIFDKINDVMHPEFDDETATNPFDFWEGANFRLRAREVDGYRNYDKSAFDAPSALSNDDAELETIWKMQHPIAAELDESKFKTYEELQQKLNRVLGGSVSTARAEDVEVPQAPAWTPPAATGIAGATDEAESVSASEAVSTPVANFEDDDESLDFFKNLAES